MLTLKRRTRGRRGERGSELIEFAILFPLLLLIVSGMVDMGFLFQTYEVVTNAAREGARIAILPNYTTNDVQNRVASYIAASGLAQTFPPPTVNAITVTLPSGATISAYEVTVTYPHTFALLAPIAKYFGGSFGTINVTSRAAMRQEMPAS